jgi:hypothetical protein
LTQSPVISACDTGVRSITRCIGWDYAKPYQSCDIVVKISNDMPLVGFHCQPYLVHPQLEENKMFFSSSPNDQCKMYFAVYGIA